MTDERLKQIETAKLIGTAAMYVEEMAAEVHRLRALRHQETADMFTTLRKAITQKDNTILELQAEIQLLKRYRQ